MNDPLNSRVSAAQQFVRLGFADIVEENSEFRSLDFLTDGLTTSDVQAVLPIVTSYNEFDGEKVATAIEQFRGKVKCWRFGRAGSPLLMAALPYWSHQAESAPLGSPAGTRITNESNQALIEEMRKIFLLKLGADKFEQNGDNDHEYGAW